MFRLFQIVLQFFEFILWLIVAENFAEKSDQKFLRNAKGKCAMAAHGIDAGWSVTLGDGGERPS